jgi:Putative MetA-pathway of phenol degradation
VSARRLALALLLLATAAARAAAQAPASTGASRPWEITDNSFLVEEAFNQEAGVFQNILTWTRGRHGTWGGSFTQEWPAPGVAHQFSYSIPFASTGNAAGVGDVLLNYRYQLREETAGGPAISPRLSVVLPTGREEDGLGGGTAGVDLNLPASKQFGDFYVHANVGYTWLPDVQATTHIAGSGIWRVAPKFNLMLESVVNVAESVTVAPGFRRGWNFGEKQLVIGLALPITWIDGHSSPALLTYFSYELPFR